MPDPSAEPAAPLPYATPVPFVHRWTWPMWLLLFGCGVAIGVVFTIGGYILMSAVGDPRGFGFVAVTAAKVALGVWLTIKPVTRPIGVGLLVSILINLLLAFGLITWFIYEFDRSSRGA